ncbi:MAG TPA: pentapeptide repeat-containing protein [Roseiflexaceae bacterium]
MARLAGWWKRVTEDWTAQRIAAVLIVVGLVVFVVGVINKHCACAGWPNPGEMLNDIISDFYANITVDCLSIAFAIFVIGRLNDRRAEQELKAQLIREMGHWRDNGIALRAVRELNVKGWIEDGSLSGADLWGARLQHANLNGADLRGAGLACAQLQAVAFEDVDLRGAYLLLANISGATFKDANLQDTDLTDQQLVTVSRLRGAIMPHGSHYDGRFMLNDDIKFTMLGDFRFADPSNPDGDLCRETANPYNPEEMACWYGVSLEEYLAGQEWARENLPRLRREAGLDPDTGEPLPSTNGAEPQPADVPAQPAPRRNGQRHKGSIVAHRARR